MFQLDFMLDLQITHVINPCEQEIRFDPTKYAKQGICYKGFICKDMPGANISQHLEECADYIDRALSMRLILTAPLIHVLQNYFY